MKPIRFKLSADLGEGGPADKALMPLIDMASIACGHSVVPSLGNRLYLPDSFNFPLQVRFIGDRMKLDHTLVALMDELELLTAGNDLVHLTVALNYGGRDEVARATKRLCREVAEGKLDPEMVDAETLARRLDTYVLPDPDLVIRTSGDARISNFLLWQSAYSEYEFVDTLWPDFTRQEFARVLAGFTSRERRYGAVPG